MASLYYRKTFALKEKVVVTILKILLLICCFVAVLFRAKPIQAQTYVFEDDFSTNLEKWQPTRDSGQYWNVYDGTLFGTIPTNYTLSELIPNNAFWDPEWHNIIYELDYTALTGADKNISFHFENVANWYEIHFGSSGIEVLRLKDGTVPWKAHRPTTIQNNVTYHFKLILNEGTISFYIDSVLIFEETDPTFTDNYGKIGLKVTAGSVAPTQISIDNVKVSLIDHAAPLLGVTHVSQLDPEWSTLEYDTATAWAPNDSSIGTWGCALSSMVMVLDFHGLTTFSDGTTITPETLNTWLLSQPDGYIGDGLLNWLAVTRLTHTLSQTFKTPKLEFTFVGTNVVETVATEITTFLRPAVINIPGHFLVAEGVIDDEPQDFYIQDPAFDYNLLSEHTTDPISARTFTPSFTDLSYFLLLSQNELTPTLTLHTENSDNPLTLQGETSSLSAVSLDTSETPFFDTSSSPVQNLWHFQKPDSGRYTLSFSGNLGESYSLQLFIYTSDGSVQIETLTGIYGSKPENYQLAFSKNEEFQIIKQLFSQQELAKELIFFFEEQLITSHFVWYELTRLITLLGSFPNQTTQIKTQFLSILEKYSESIQPNTRTYLQAKIELL